MTHKVDIFITATCPFCQRAMAWLKENEVPHNLTVFASVNEKMQFYASHPDVTTVPQIFVDGKRIGGWSDLVKSDFKREIEEARAKN